MRLRGETGEGGRPVLWGPWSPLGTGFQEGGRISWLDPPGNLIRAINLHLLLELHFSLPAAVLLARVTPSSKDLSKASKASLEVVTQDGEACLVAWTSVALKEGPALLDLPASRSLGAPGFAG